VPDESYFGEPEEVDHLVVLLHGPMSVVLELSHFFCKALELGGDVLRYGGGSISENLQIHVSKSLG